MCVFRESSRLNAPKRKQENQEHVISSQTAPTKCMGHQLVTCHSLSMSAPHKPPRCIWQHLKIALLTNEWHLIYHREPPPLPLQTLPCPHPLFLIPTLQRLCGDLRYLRSIPQCFLDSSFVWKLLFVGCARTCSAHQYITVIIVFSPPNTGSLKHSLRWQFCCLRELHLPQGGLTHSHSTPPAPHPQPIQPSPPPLLPLPSVFCPRCVGGCAPRESHSSGLSLSPVTVRQWKQWKQTQCVTWCYSCFMATCRSLTLQITVTVPWIRWMPLLKRPSTPYIHSYCPNH